MILSSDDLPVPLGPTTPILAPWRNERVTLSRTTLSPWALRTLRSVKTYSAMRASLRGSAPAPTIAPVGPDGTAHAARAGCSATPASSTAGAATGVLPDGSRGRRRGAGPGEHGGAVREVVAHRRGDDLEGRLRLAVALPDVGHEPTVHDDRVAAGERGRDVAAEAVPRLDGVPRGRALHPLAVAVSRRGAGHPEGGDGSSVGRARAA